MFLECSKLLETPTGHSETIHGHSRSYCRKPLADRLAPRVPATAQHVKATWLGHVNTIPLGEKHEKTIKTKQTKKRCPASFLSANASFWYRDWKSLPFLSNLLHGHESNSLNTTTPAFFSFSIQLTYFNKTQPHKTKYEQHLLDCPEHHELEQSHIPSISSSPEKQSAKKHHFLQPARGTTAARPTRHPAALECSAGATGLSVPGFLAIQNADFLANS